MTTAVSEKPRVAAVIGRLPGRPALRRAIPPSLAYCAGVYLAIRAGLFALGAAAWVLSPERLHPARYGGVALRQSGGWHNAVTGWARMDAQQFLYVAHHGYSSGSPSGAFYPGYPVLVRAVSYLTAGHMELAGYVVSNAALLAALLVLYHLTQREYDQQTARRAVLYLCLFPTAFFLFDVYSESVFLLAVVGSIALARQGRWGWAGLAGTWATFTRATGVVVCLALAAEAVHQAVEERKHAAGPQHAGRRRTLVLAGRLAASAVPASGLGCYLLFWQLRYHNWSHPLRLEQVDWHRVFMLPWDTLWYGMTAAFCQHGLSHGWQLLDFVLVAAGLALGVWVAVRARPVYAVYTWASIVFFLCSTKITRPLVSDPRYLAVVFPLAWALARAGRRPAVDGAVVAVSGATLAIMGWLFLSTNGIY